MSGSTSNWVKIETKSSKKKAAPKGGEFSEDKSPKKGGGVGGPVQNGSIKKATGGKIAVSNIFGSFFEGTDNAKKKASGPVKNGKAASKGGKNGLKIISGEDLIKKGGVTSKYGEQIRFITKDTTQAKEANVKKLTTNNSAKKPVANGSEKQPKNFKLNLNLSCLNEESVRDEIESLAGIDLDKRCLSLALYLNVQKPHVEPPGWETSSFDSCEPLRSVPKPVENVLTEFVRELPQSSAGLSFEMILAELITKMLTNTTTIWGFRVMLQILAREQPDAAIMKQHKNLSRLFANNMALVNTTSRASAISWAIMQPYFVDPKKAMAIWCKILLPHISNKNLAPVICACLDRLMLTDSLVLQSQTLSHYDYFHLLDYTFPQPGMQNLVDAKSHRKFQNYYPKFKAMSLSSSNVSNFFSSYLSRYKENQSSDMREELFTCITTCLRYNSAICYEMWSAMLLGGSYEQQSLLFLKDFCQRGPDDLPDGLPMKQLKQFLERASQHVAKNKRTATSELAQVLEHCNEIVDKRPQKKNVRFENGSKDGKSRTRKSFLFSPFFMMLTLLFFVALAELWTGGDQSYTKHAIDKGLVICNNSHKWLLKNYPTQTRFVSEKTNQAIAYLQPIITQAIGHVTPIINQAIDHVQPIINQVIDHVKPIINQAIDHVQPIITNGVKWVKINTPKTLDYIYRDGPVQAYTYFEKNIYPGCSKYFNKNVRPSWNYVSNQLNTMIDVVYASIDLSFLKPYLS